MEFIEKYLPNILNFLMQIVFILLVLIIGLRLIKWIVKLVKKSLEKAHVEMGLATFLCSLLKYALYFVLVMIILGQFGVTTSSVVAVLGSVGLTLGLSLQGSLSNFAGGVLILLIKPFVVGDYIIDNASGAEGTVKEITIFYTKLLTGDNKMILLPNGTLSNSSITNTTKMDKRRVDITVGVSYNADLSKVKEVLQQVVDEEKKVLREEPINVFVSELADSSITMGIRVWSKTGDYWDVKWRMTEEIKNAFDKNGIEIPFPQMDIHMKNN